MDPAGEPPQAHRSGFGRLVALVLVVVPLLSIPLYLLGNRVADALDRDSSDGVFALGLLLGVGGPTAVAAAIAARRVRLALAAVLGLAAGAVAAVVLLAAFVVYCSGDRCIS